MQNKNTLLFTAIILILAGLLLSLENLMIIKGISVHWPVFLLITGFGFVLLFFHKKNSDEALLWLGTFLFFSGAFFYYLNFTSWSKLAVLWPLFLGLVGVSFLSIGIVKRQPVFHYFAVSFIALFLTFTLVFTVSIQLWPMSFVVFGACLLALEYLHRRMKL